jgi:hypothetical protein
VLRASRDDRRNAGDGLIVGTAGDDVIDGFRGFDRIRGLGGDDRICGGGDSDFVRGGGATTRSMAPAGRYRHGGPRRRIVLGAGGVEGCSAGRATIGCSVEADRSTA